MTIAELLRARAAEGPDRHAILAPDRQPLSYRGLLDHVDNVVESLNNMGISRNDRVGIVLPNGPEMAVSFLAVAAGACSAPLNPSYRASEFEFYLSDLNAKAVIVASDLDSSVRDVALQLGVPVIDLTPMSDGPAGLFELKAIEAGKPTEGGADPGDVGLVLHTSGTTSRPKIVPLSQTNICTSAHNIRTQLELTPHDRCLNVMPLFHIHGLIGATLSSISSGASLVCTPGFRSDRFYEWLSTAEPTWYTAVPTMHQAVVSMAEDNDHRSQPFRMRFIRSSSASLPPIVMAKLEELFDAPVVESYGMTEAAHQMTSNPLPPSQRKPGSVGLPAGPEVAIMDDAGAMLAQGQRGEIVIRGENVTSGYDQNPEANAAAFTNGWFRTGDEGWMDEDGYLYLSGRLKEIINRGGQKIAPREIDEALLEHIAVNQAVAFAVPHPTLGEDVAAAVILESGAVVDAKTLRAHAFEKLADYKVPSQILIVDQIPKGPTGKLQRIGLAGKLQDELATRYEPPTDELEERLVDIWEDTLSLDNVGVEDNFFSLGGDSLSAALLFAKVEEDMGEELPLAILFRAPTARQLAAAIRDRTWSTARASLVPIQPEGDRAPLFFVHAHGGNVIGYHDLARHLGPDQPFYGLQSQNIDRSEPRPQRFEDMAAHYVDEIRTVQPEGPYFLGGWCMGGAVAYEMAQQLTAAGETVALLLMVQTTHPDYPRYRPASTRLHRSIYPVIDRIGLEISNLVESAPGNRMAYSAERTRRLGGTLLAKGEALVRPLLSSGSKLPQSDAYRRKTIEATHLQDYDDYHAQPYRDPVTVLLAENQPHGIEHDDTLGWGPLFAGSVEVHEIPGYRLGMISGPRAETTARVVEDCLARAASRFVETNG